jgi:hypothetical protein
MLKSTLEVYLTQKVGSTMFRKLVSNLSFSPALVGQIAFYAKRLKKEETTRRLGLLFTVFALIIQAFVVLIVFLISLGEHIFLMVPFNLLTYSFLFM